MTTPTIANGTHHAVTYAKAGFSVVPLTPGEKSPLGVRDDDGAGGVYLATTDPARAAELFTDPRSGVGICAERTRLDGTARLLVLDADDEESKAFLTDLIGEPTIMTGGRGGHWYVVLKSDLPAALEKTSAKKDAKLEIDIFGTPGSGYVVAPPSRFRDRPPYTWTGTLHTETDALRAWLDDLAAKTAARNAERRERATVDGGTDPAVDEWATDTDWHDLLTDEGWIQTDLFDRCNCPVWQHPWGAHSPRSATAHGEGCTSGNSTAVGGTLKVWSTTAQAHLSGDENYTKYAFVIASRYDGDARAAREGEGIASNGGDALDIDGMVYEPKPEAVNPFLALAGSPLTAVPTAPPAALQPQAPTPAPLALTPRTAEDVRDGLERIKAWEVPTTPTNADGKVVGWDGIARTPREHVRVNKHKAIAELFFTATPELANVWNVAVAKGNNPWGLMTYLIPLVLGDIPPEYVLPESNGDTPSVREAGGSLNTIGYITAFTAQGKGNTVRAGRTIYPHATAERKPSSTAEGIYKAYMCTKEGKADDGTPERQEWWYTDSVLVQVNEVEKFNNELARDKSNTAGALCELYMGEDTGTNTGDKDRRTNLPAHMYRFGMVAFGQPSLSGELLAQEEIGLSLRITWAPGKADWVYQPIGNGAWHKMPASPFLLPAFAPSPNSGMVPPIGGTGSASTASIGAPSDGKPHHVIPWAPAAVAEVKAAEAERTRRAIATGYDEVDDAIDKSGHETFTRLKNTVAVGVINKRTAPDDLDWYLAGCLQYMSQLQRETLKEAVGAVSDNRGKKVARERGVHAAVAEDAKRDYRESQITEAAERIMASTWTGATTAGVCRVNVWTGKNRPSTETVTAALDLLTESGYVTRTPGKHPKYTRSGGVQGVA